MKALLKDTLFKRLFILMWVALVVSHLASFLSVQTLIPPPPGGPGASGPPGLPRTMPSLPPMGPPPGMGPRPDGGPPERAPGPPNAAFDGPPPEAGDAPPTDWLWLDYLVRAIVIGAGAWVGARWLSAPIRQLANASQALGQAIASRTPGPALDEHRGTLEVRQTAKIFNTMSRRLHEQFGAQALLMAAISHDLRTPLARLRLRLEQLEPGSNVERCANDVREMDQLITSVLEMMQLTHEPAAQQQVDLRALVQSLADDLAEQGQAVSLAATANEAPAVVRGQPAALSRVVGNLLGNAVRYGGAAEVAVNVQAGQVQVSIDDRGPGIPAHQLETVFQPFYRVDSSRSKQTGGTGLGLYIARDLAQRHSGQVILMNRSGGGLRAVLSLPLAD
jgi:signal transduction histidine kinase